MITREELLEWQARFDELSIRERLLVLGIALAVVISCVQMLLVDPLLAERELKSRKIATLHSEVQQQVHKEQILIAELAAGVNRGKERRAESMQEQLQKLDERIEQSLVAMIPPRLMTQVLENVLQQDDELTLLALENLPVQSIVKRETDEDELEPVVSDGQTVSSGLYRHGFVLTLKGSYPATVRYLEKLAQLPWEFHWDDLRYEVSKYPDATIVLQVHTVSMSEDWIGV